MGNMVIVDILPSNSYVEHCFGVTYAFALAYHSLARGKMPASMLSFFLLPHS